MGVGICPQPREHVFESSHLVQGQTKNEITKVFCEEFLRRRLSKEQDQEGTCSCSCGWTTRRLILAGPQKIVLTAILVVLSAD